MTTSNHSVFHRLFSLDGKTALVTGASGGIGRVLALTLAEAGATVGVNGQSKGRLEELQAEIDRAGGRSVALAASIDKVEDCRALIASAQDALGRLDILVNCAGINRRKPIRDVTEEDFDAITAVNLRSLFFLCQAAYPLMREQGGGKIVNVGSVTSLTGLGGVAVYGATKAAVAQLTATMALEWGRDNIQVNCLVPGFIMTPLTEQGLWGDPWRREWILQRVAARRPGTPEDLAGAALLMVAPASSYMTGQTITVDGGFLAGGSWLRDDE